MKQQIWCFMKSKFFTYAGFAAVLFMVVPYILLGTDAVVTFHDQLDGELFAYIFHARNLFFGDIIPQFLGGVPKTALTPPAPFSILFFLSGHYFAALVIMQMLGSVTGYIGMYLLAQELTKNRLAAAVAGVLFAYLPLLPVYGLSHFGIPLRIWFFLKMKDGEHRKNGFIYTVFFALNSSLVLVGFIVAGLYAVGIVYVWVKHRRMGKGDALYIKPLIFAWFGMIAAYVLTNLSLISQVLGLTDVPVSHKTEYVYQAENFWQILFAGFINGRDHSMSHHVYVLTAAVLVLALYAILGLARNPGNKEKHNLYKIIIFLLALNFTFTLIASLWNSAPGVWLRTQLDIFGTFQLTRVMWLSPTIWYLLIALLIAFVLHNEARNPKHTGLIRHKLLAMTPIFIVLLATALTAFSILMASNLKLNLQKLMNPEYNTISYSDYYALSVLDQVETYIREETGLAQSDYRVISLGINPAAALYNGFYCLDGYSNNYPLEYKHEFRRIIAAELGKDENNRRYFDYWGNRCYIFSAENDGPWPLKKNTFTYQDLNIDIKSFREMGGKYLISAAYIENAEAIGLRLARNEAFETPDSYVEIFLYEIGKE
jgi:hypothetical protein